MSGGWNRDLGVLDIDWNRPRAKGLTIGFSGFVIHRCGT
jgi:hypothetical protein